MAYDSLTLLNQIKNRAAVPANQSTFDDQDLLDIANEAVTDDILPDILKARQEFFVYSEDFTPVPSSPYPYIRIPERAVGQSIVDIVETPNENMVDPTTYYIEGSKIYFTDNSTAAKRIKYHLRPGKLIETSACGTISSINPTTGEVTCSTVPTTFSSNVKYDFIRGKAGFDLLAKDLSCTLVANVATFTLTDIPSELQIGDYLCLADTSPVPQIPVEWFSYLAQHTAALVLESLGDMEAAKKVEARLGRMRANALSLISPRIERVGKAIKTDY